MNNLTKSNTELLKTSNKVRTQVALNERVEFLVDYLCDKNRIRTIYILGDCRVKAANEIRYVLYLVLRESGYTYSEIARSFGKSHSSISRLIKRFKSSRDIEFWNPWGAFLVERKPMLMDLRQVNRDYSKKIIHKNLLNGRYAHEDK